jgi:hypothetical protein
MGFFSYISDLGSLWAPTEQTTFPGAFSTRWSQARAQALAPVLKSGTGGAPLISPAREGPIALTRRASEPPSFGIQERAAEVVRCSVRPHGHQDARSGAAPAACGGAQ